MYNILITDDEQIAIDSLKFIISKNFDSNVTLFTAQSGTDALQIINQEKIDIVFMDINMPGLTGLDTVSCINKLRPETVIIIISAFDRFQYAQEAMNLGVFKYITKPVNRNVIIQTVRESMNIVDNRRGQHFDEDALQRKMDMFSPMIENDFIYACIFNNEKSKFIFDSLSGAEGVKSVSGMGLMIGVETEKSAKDIAAACMEKGVLVLTAKSKVRLLPALNIPADELKKGIEILKAVIAE